MQIKLPDICRKQITLFDTVVSSYKSCNFRFFDKLQIERNALTSKLFERSEICPTFTHD